MTYLANVNCGGPNDWCLVDRLHVRGHKLSLPDPQYGNLWITPLTPHYDDATDECGDEGSFGPITVHNKHVIREDFWNNNSGISGFTAARDIVMWNMITSGHHVNINTENWGNVGTRLQCNGEVSGANGEVYMIGM